MSDESKRGAQQTKSAVAQILVSPTPYQAYPDARLAPAGESKGGDDQGAGGAQGQMSVAELLAANPDAQALENEKIGTDSPGGDTGADAAPETMPDAEASEDILASETEGGQEEGASEEAEASEEADSRPEISELAEKLEAFSPAERQHLFELAEKLKPGEVPRIKKLLAKQHQLEERAAALERELLQARAASGGEALPPNLAALKTVEDVQARIETVRNAVETLTDMLDALPGDPDTVYDAETGRVAEAEPDGKRFFTRRDIIARRAALRAELAKLPVRAEQLRRASELEAQRREARARVFRELPQLSDPEHPDAIAVEQELKRNPWLTQVPFLSPELEAYIRVLGVRELQRRIEGKRAAAQGTLGTEKRRLGTARAGGAGAVAGRAALKLPQNGEILGREVAAALLAAAPK